MPGGADSDPGDGIDRASGHATAPSSTGPSPGTVDKLRTMLAGIWRKNEESLYQRLQAIRHFYTLEQEQNAAADPDQAKAAPAIGTARSDARNNARLNACINARNAAHKLAGVLGSFGLPAGTDLAREAEEMLDQAGDLERGGNLDPSSLARIGSLVTELEALVANKSEELREGSPAKLS